MARDALSFEYPTNVRFKCERCALCCGDTEYRRRNILLMEPEARRISRETSTPIYRFANRLEGSRPYVYSVKKTQAGKCMFLKGNICSIYRARPLVCRFYPFELKTKLGRHVFSYTNECPSINHGPTLRREYFVRLFQRLVVLDEKTISTE